jgi:hypothetical protein
LPTTLSVVLTTLGIIALARHAFVTWSMSAPLALVMASYNATMQLLFGWAHPYLQAALTWLGSFIGWRPTLHPHWKDVFVVISLIGVSAGRTNWGQLNTEMYVAWSVGPILGAAVAAIAAGVLPLQSPDLITQLLIAGSLGLAVLPIFVVISVLRSEIESLRLALIAALIASASAALGTLWFYLLLGRAEGLGLAGIASVVVLFGLLVSLPRDRQAKVDRSDLQWGLTILGGFVGAAFVAAVDAGLKLLGA